MNLVHGFYVSEAFNTLPLLILFAYNIFSARSWKLCNREIHPKMFHLPNHDFFFAFSQSATAFKNGDKVQAFDPVLGQWLNGTVLDVDNGGRVLIH